MRSTVGGVLLGLALVVAAPSPAAAIPLLDGEVEMGAVCERVDLRVPGPGIRFLQPAAAAMGGAQQGIQPLAVCEP